MQAQHFHGTIACQMLQLLSTKPHSLTHVSTLLTIINILILPNRNCTFNLLHCWSIQYTYTATQSPPTTQSFKYTSYSSISINYTFSSRAATDYYRSECLIRSTAQKDRENCLHKQDNLHEQKVKRKRENSENTANRQNRVCLEVTTE
jgi:hypothetical protein